MAALIKAERDQKLHELGHMIRGTSAGLKTKGASIIDKEKKVTLRLRPILSEKQKKLKELGKMVRGP